MNHGFSGSKLNRNPSHRSALYRNLARSLILSCDSRGGTNSFCYGRIITTVPKAKAIRRISERLITWAKRADAYIDKASAYGDVLGRQSLTWHDWCQTIAPAVALRRRAFSILRDKKAVNILFTDLASRFRNRDGGYTRIVRMSSFRIGDAGRMCLVEFTGNRDRK